MDKFENVVYRSLTFLLIISAFALIGMVLNSSCSNGFGEPF